MPIPAVEKEYQLSQLIRFLFISNFSKILFSIKEVMAQVAMHT